MRRLTAASAADQSGSSIPAAISSVSITSLSVDLARHRFARASSGGGVSILYLPILLFPVVVLASLYLAGRIFYLQFVEGSETATTDVLLRVLWTLYSFYGVILLVFAGLLFLFDVISRLHRRLLGVLAFALFAFNFLAYLVLAGAFAWQPQSVLPASATSEPPLTVAIVVFAVLSWAVMAVITAELVIYFAWQCVAPREDFLVVRGWRPPFWRFPSNLRRALGLPAFLSVLRRRRLVLTLLYFVVAFVNSPFFLLMFVPVLFFRTVTSEARPGFETSPWIGLAVSAAVMGVPVLLGLLGVGRAADAAARRRATDVYQGVREWDGRRPLVFLRAFKSDTATLPLKTADPILTWPGGLAGKRSLDEILLEHGSLYGPVIAIGDPSQPLPPLGAARVFVKDDSWQSAVQSLTDAAQCIVICPNKTPGVAWELNLVASAERLSKTIFLRDPTLAADDASSLVAYLPASAANGRHKARRGEVEVALYFDDERGWTLLTCRRPTCHAYEIALKKALYRKTGVLHVPLGAVH